MIISEEPAFKAATLIEEFIALDDEARIYRMAESAKAGHAQAMRDLAVHLPPTRPPVPDIGLLETLANLAAAHQSFVRTVGAGA